MYYILQVKICKLQSISTSDVVVQQKLNSHCAFINGDIFIVLLYIIVIPTNEQFHKILNPEQHKSPYMKHMHETVTFCYIQQNSFRFVPHSELMQST
jgi:hypothetical protein